METFIPLSLIVLLANIVEAVSGFGATIISVTLGSNLYSIEFLLPVLVPLNLLLSLYIVSRYHKHIDKQFLLKKVLPFTGAGLVTGIIIFNILNGSTLKIMYGILVIILSIRELFFLLKKNSKRKDISKKQTYFWLAAAGIMQGIYASGGPLMVYAMNSLKLDKSSFRSTLSTIWLTANTILTFTYLQSGSLTAETLQYSGMLLPVLLLGIYAGEKLHHFLNERLFKISVFFLLLLAGFSLLKG